MNVSNRSTVNTTFELQSDDGTAPTSQQNGSLVIISVVMPILLVLFCIAYTAWDIERTTRPEKKESSQKASNTHVKVQPVDMKPKRLKTKIKPKRLETKETPPVEAKQDQLEEKNTEEVKQEKKIETKEEPPKTKVKQESKEERKTETKECLEPVNNDNMKPKRMKTKVQKPQVEAKQEQLDVKEVKL